MKKQIRTAIVGAALAVGMLGGGAIATAQTTTTTTAASTSSTTSSATARPSRADHAAQDAKRDKELAAKLGVTVDQITAARKAANTVVDAKYGAPPDRPSASSNTKPAKPTAAQAAAMKARHTLFEKTFAEKLGVTVTQLRAAEMAIAKTHLAADVAAGRITQAQADAQLAAIANGTAGPGGPGGHGGPPPAK